MYSDVWAPVTEVVICVGLCIILGQKWGLNGILLSFVIAEFFIKMIWKPYYLFSFGFRESVIKQYWCIMIKYVFIFVMTMIVNIRINNC